MDEFLTLWTDDQYKVQITAVMQKTKIQPVMMLVPPVIHSLQPSEPCAVPLLSACF
jgi:hypothetical protein